MHIVRCQICGELRNPMTRMNCPKCHPSYTNRIDEPEAPDEVRFDLIPFETWLRLGRNAPRLLNNPMPGTNDDD